MVTTLLNSFINIIIIFGTKILLIGMVLMQVKLWCPMEITLVKLTNTNSYDGMKENINNSRLIVNAWNPAEITETTLAPCHTGFQVVGCKEVLNYIGHKDQLMCFLVYHLT
jgi:hypothetical protein